MIFGTSIASGIKDFFVSFLAGAFLEKTLDADKKKKLQKAFQEAGREAARNILQLPEFSGFDINILKQVIDEIKRNLNSEIKINQFKEKVLFPSGLNHITVAKWFEKNIQLLFGGGELEQAEKFLTIVSGQLCSIAHLFQDASSLQFKTEFELLKVLQEKLDRTAQQSTLMEIRDVTLEILHILQNKTWIESNEGAFPLKRIEDCCLYKDKPTPSRKSQKGKQSDFSRPCFVRPWGPAWIDFEKGFVWENKKLIKKYIYQIRNPEHKHPAILKGEAASGKSVLMRSIAYHLICDFGETIFYVPLKPGEYPAPPKDFPFKEFEKSGGYLFVDDAHIDNGNWIRDFLRDTRCTNRIKSRMLIASRPMGKGHTSERESEDRNQGKYSFDAVGSFEHYLAEANEINAIDFIEPIFDHWLKVKEKQRKLKIAVSEEIRESLFEKVGDLWLLAFCLDAFEGMKFHIAQFPDISNIIYDYIKKGIPAIYRESDKISSLKYSDEILLPIAYSFQFEIPFPENVMEKIIDMLIKIYKRFDFSQTIERLEDIRELIHADRSYSLPHSARAKAFLEAFIRIPQSAGRMKEILTNYSFEYFLSSPKDLSWRLGLIKILIDKNPSSASLIIIQEDDRIIKEIVNLKNSPNILLSLFNNTDDLRLCCQLMDIFHITGYKIWEKFCESFSPSELVCKIQETENLVSAARLVDSFKKAGYQRWNEIEPKELAHIIQETWDLWGASIFIDSLKKARYQRWGEFFEFFPPSELVRKIKKTENLWVASSLVDSFKETGYQRWEEFFSFFPPENFHEHFKYWIKNVNSNKNELINSFAKAGYPYTAQLRDKYFRKK